MVITTAELYSLDLKISLCDDLNPVCGLLEISYDENT